MRSLYCTCVPILMQEVKWGAPSAHLSFPLRCRMEKLDVEARKEICSKSKEGCSPLFVACKKGNVEVIYFRISSLYVLELRHLSLI